jgi:curved DNA-binding protein CbpA
MCGRRRKDPAMKNRRNYYRILQVQPDAPSEVIRASFRTLMLELKQHPDLGGASLDAALLNEAWETLRDPERRAAYDQALRTFKVKRAFELNRVAPTAVLCPVCEQPYPGEPGPDSRCATCQSPLPSGKTSACQKSNGRSIARIKKEQPILYYSAWPGEAREAKMVDFSPKGMRFRCRDRLAVETVVKIKSELFEASAMVTNVREENVADRTSYAIGVAFLAIAFLEPRGTFLSTSA